MTIDLTAAYRRVGEMLDEAGHTTVAYSLDLTWWRHRITDDAKGPTAAVYISWKTVGESYKGDTFDEAIRLLAEDLPNRPVSPPPTRAEVSDVEVVF